MPDGPDMMPSGPAGTTSAFGPHTDLMAVDGEQHAGTAKRPEAGGGSGRRPKRPAFGLVIGAAAVLRVSREFLPRIVFERYGLAVGVAAVVAVPLAIVAWHLVQRRRWKAQGGETTPELVVDQVERSGIAPPAFAADGTLLGAPILVVNQRTKLLEVTTGYDIFGHDGRRLGSITQFGQSRAKKIVRVLTSFDQFFTHHFEIHDATGATVLRLTRPAKVFRTRVNVFDGADRYLGTIRQENVFGRIRFVVTTSNEWPVARLTARNLRAWDFALTDLHGDPLVEMVKTWEGWMRTAATRSDRYVVRLTRPLDEPVRSLALAAALTIDVALKQDARAFG